jgi:hypothetical protein
MQICPCNWWIHSAQMCSDQDISTGGLVVSWDDENDEGLSEPFEKTWAVLPWSCQIVIVTLTHHSPGRSPLKKALLLWISCQVYSRVCSLASQQKNWMLSVGYQLLVSSKCLKWVHTSTHLPCRSDLPSWMDAAPGWLTVTEKHSSKLFNMIDVDCMQRASTYFWMHISSSHVFLCFHSFTSRRCCPFTTCLLVSCIASYWRMMCTAFVGRINYPAHYEPQKVAM